MKRNMAKGSSKEAKEEGEISDNEADENPLRVLKSVPILPGNELQPLALGSLGPPTQFIGRSNRPKAKVGNAKFLRGSSVPEESRPKYGKRLPSPKRVLPTLMEVKLKPSRGMMQNPSKQNNSVSNHIVKPDRQGVNRSERPGGIERMLNVPNKDTVNVGLPKKSPGSKLWERRRLRSAHEDKEKENETSANDQDFGTLLEKYKQIQEKLADIRKEEETVLQKHNSKKIVIEVKNDLTKESETEHIEADEKKVPEVQEGLNGGHWTVQPAASPPVSGKSSPIIIDDDIPEYTVVDEVGEKTDGTDGDKTSTANSDDEELDELELRRNALSSLASAMSKAEELGQLTDENSNQEPSGGSHIAEMTSHSPERDKQGQRSKVEEGSRYRWSRHMTASRPPAREPARRRQHSQEGRDMRARQAARNRMPSGRSHYPRQSTSDHKLYEARRRSSASRDYDYHRRDDTRKREEEESRLRSPERDRKKDKEGSETQTT